MKDKCISLWRKKFREYVRDNVCIGLGLCDEDGNPIAFRNGKPMWNEDHVVLDCGDFVAIIVHKRPDDWKDGDRISTWLRRFAATMERFSVEVGFSESDTGAARMLSVSAEIPKELSKRAGLARKRSVDSRDEFWIVGDPTIRMYMRVEGRGYHGDSCESTEDALLADRYATYEEAVEALCSNSDVIMWAAGTPFPSRVVPIKVGVNVRLGVGR